MRKHRDVLVVLFIVLLLIGFSLTSLAQDLKGWAVVKERQEESDEYSPKENNIIYLIEAQFKNVSSDSFLLNRLGFKLKDEAGYLHPCHSLMPPGETNFTVLKPGAVLWYTWAFSAPKDINPKEMIVGPGTSSGLGAVDVRIPVRETRPEELLKQTMESTKAGKSIRVCKLRFSLEKYHVTDSNLKVIFKILNPTNERVKLGVMDCAFQDPFLIGNFGKIHTETTAYLWSDRNLPPTMKPGETVKVKDKFPLKDLASPYYLGLYVGASARDLGHYFWKVP